MFSCRLPGIDVVLEGRVDRVSDIAMLERIVAVYRQGGWPAQVDSDAFTAPYSAPSAGPPPWRATAFRTAFGVATIEPRGAARWRLD
jgi:hypothetical protein